MKKSICIFFLSLALASQGAAQDDLSNGILEESPILSLLPEPGTGLLDDDPMDTENGPAPGDIPVDGGLSLLLAAGAAFGGRRLHAGVRQHSSMKSGDQYPQHP